MAESNGQPETDDVVFVISRIGEKNSPERKRADEIFEYVVRPVVEELDLRASRSDLDPTPGRITTQIIKGIITAKVVVADLTGQSPNVLFELGIAESFAKPLVLLVKHTDDLCFDIKDEKTIVVGDADVLGVGEAEDAKRQLRESMDVVLKEDYIPVNLVTEVAAARSLDALAPENPVASEISVLREEMAEVLTRVRTLSRRGQANPRDSQRVREFVQTLVEADRLSPDELYELPTDMTSVAFDNWAAKQGDRATEVEQLARARHAPEEPF